MIVNRSHLSYKIDRKGIIGRYYSIYSMIQTCFESISIKIIFCARYKLLSIPQSCKSTRFILFFHSINSLIFFPVIILWFFTIEIINGSPCLYNLLNSFNVIISVLNKISSFKNLFFISSDFFMIFSFLFFIIIIKSISEVNLKLFLAYDPYNIIEIASVDFIFIICGLI